MSEKKEKSQDELHKEFMRKRREAKQGGGKSNDGKIGKAMGEAVKATVMAQPGGLLNEVGKKIKEAFGD